MPLQVPKDELIAVWLQRELENNWRYIEPVAQYRAPGMNREQIRRIVFEPNYQETRENFLRYIFLLSFRLPLLRPICIGTWYETTLTEDEFKELRVIARDPSWISLSSFNGRLSNVAERIFERNPDDFSNLSLQGIANTIQSMLRSEINKRLYIIRHEESEVKTILEGNKSAVALYIKHYLSKESSYSPLTIFLGNLESKSFWQW